MPDALPVKQLWKAETSSYDSKKAAAGWIAREPAQGPLHRRRLSQAGPKLGRDGRVPLRAHFPSGLRRIPEGGPPPLPPLIGFARGLVAPPAPAPPSPLLGLPRQEAAGPRLGLETPSRGLSGPAHPSGGHRADAPNLARRVFAFPAIIAALELFLLIQ